MNEDGPLTEVITAYLQAVDAGQTPDQDEILAKHPELTVELHRFFATHDRLNNIAEPLRPELPVVPRRFGDYQILGEIGRGGMGVVYRARQVSLGRVVALKMLAGGSGEQQAERLQQESRLLAELEHPNIVPVYDVGQHEGRAFFAMKEIEGRNLEEALPALRQDVREGVRILAVVARAVHFAHQKGVLHRDLKPANVLLDEHGTPYVTDFGLARRLDNSPALTQTGALVGTPGYMAPEQAIGDRTLTAAVDVWALGVMLYRLLTGESPFRGDTPLETLHRIVAGRMRPLGKVALGEYRALETICLRCLEKEPADRYPTAAAMAEDLERFSRGESFTAVVPSRRRSRMRRWAVGVLALCIVGLGLVGYRWLTSERGWDDAEQLFRAMEKRISAANALEVAINGRLEGAKVLDGTNVAVASEFQASLLWADGNKARFECTVTIADQVLEFKMISDGTRTKDWQKPPGREKVTDTEKYLSDQTAGMLRRTGVGSSIFFVRGGGIPRDKKSDEWFQVSEFKLGSREKIGMRQGQGIEYKLSLPDGRTLPVKLWIDTETLLPLKRVVAGRVGTDDFQVTETYQEVQLDPPIDAERFQLPK